MVPNSRYLDPNRGQEEGLGRGKTCWQGSRPGMAMRL